MENLKETVQEDSFDIKEFIYKLLDFWYLFAISLLISFGIAFYINKSADRIYEVKCSILLKSDQPVIDAKFGFGSNLMNTSYFIFNEIGILNSYFLTDRAISKLDFTVSYHEKTRFSTNELYNDCPFIFIIDSVSPQPLNIDILINVISPNTFLLEADAENVSFYSYALDKPMGWRQKYSFSNQYKLDYFFTIDNFSGKIIPRNSVDLRDYIGKTYCIKFNNKKGLVGQFRKFNVTTLKNSSILELSMQGNNRKKLSRFLNALSEEYLIKGLERKNQIADNTIRFIDTQLGEVSDSLFFSEKRLQDYRATHALMNIDMQTQKVFAEMDDLQKKKSGFVIKNKYFQYLKKYLSEVKNGQDLVSPTSMDIEDATISKMINEITVLYNERWELSQNLKRDNPMVESLDNKIQNFKKLILDNVKNLENANKIAIQEIENQIDHLSKRMNTLPETERKLFGYERKFKFNDALYTFLLTKQSEVQISKASYMPDNEILDYAREEDGFLISPKTRQNYLIALILALGLPILLLLLKDFFNNKISTNDDIEAVTNFPVIGYVVHSKEKTYTVVADEPLSLPAESIRAIRTNFQFIGNDTGKNVVMVTSSMMGEGKSFISLNLALSFALNNKKTILLNFDLRKPKVHEYLDIDNKLGLSLYLSGNVEIKDIITKTAFENFDIILAGAIPPNPMELIAGPKTQVLIEQLKNEYDYIIMDTPPVGMVADSMILVKYADTTLYIARQNYALKNVFAQQMQNLVKRNIPNVNIILNDVQIGSKYNSYSYGYAYAYGYGYTDKEKRKKSKLT